MIRLVRDRKISLLYLAFLRHATYDAKRNCSSTLPETRRDDPEYGSSGVAAGSYLDLLFPRTGAVLDSGVDSTYVVVLLDAVEAEGAGS